MRTEHEQAMESFAKASTWMEKTGGYAHSMTLRDYYAGLAMQAQLSIQEISLAIGQKRLTTQEVCGSCYEWADLMLKERAK